VHFARFLGNSSCPMVVSLSDILEDHALRPCADSRWSSDLALEIAEQREQLQHFMSRHRLRTESLETALSAQLDEVVALAGSQARRQHEVEAEELAHERVRLQEKLAHLERQTEELDELRTRTRHQRRRLAQEFQNERQALQRQDDCCREKLEHIAELITERDTLAEELTAAEQLLEQSHADAGETAELAELRQRFQASQAEIHELQHRISELEHHRPQRQATAAAANEPSDWESQKRRLLAALEADEDPDEEAAEERLTIDGTIRITDAVVSDKDREIRELKQLLDHQSQNVGSMAIGAAALGAVLDQDEIIQAERQRLAQLQTEWDTKFRQAEIDLSRERAKLARERADLDEKQRRLSEQQAQDHEENDDGSMKDKKPVRGRWLARLGLKEQDPSES
jgi:hypothetical protein